MVILLLSSTYWNVDVSLRRVQLNLGRLYVGWFWPRMTFGRWLAVCMWALAAYILIRG